MSPKQKDQLDEEIAVASAMADEAIADEQAELVSQTHHENVPDVPDVPDTTSFGEDAFQLLYKTSDTLEDYTQSTKAMDVGKGCIVRVTTQQRNPDGSYSVAEAVTYVPGVTVVEQYTPTTDDYDGTSKELVGRRLKGVR